MSDPIRPTHQHAELKDAEIQPPPFGKKVLALNKAGVLCFTVVDHNFNMQFDAWSEYPKVPASVKLRQRVAINLAKTI